MPGFRSRIHIGMVLLAELRVGKHGSHFQGQSTNFVEARLSGLHVSTFLSQNKLVKHLYLTLTRAVRYGKCVIVR